MTRLEKIAAVIGAEGLDAILLTGDYNLLYATQLCGLEGVVLITASGRGWCLTDSRYIESAQGSVAPRGYTVQLNGGAKYSKMVAGLLAEIGGIDRLGFEDHEMSVSQHGDYAGALTCALVPASCCMEVLREVKEEWEVEQITAAQRIAEQALKQLLPDIKPGRTEQELAARLNYNMANLGSTEPAFSTIFVSGPNSSLPHGVPTGKKIENGDFVTIDFGATCNGYRSDMTRTFAVGSADDEMRRVYATVLEAQLAGIEAIDAGKSGHDVHMAAHNVIEKAGYGRYFGHGLGHSLGLQVHENPRAAKNRNEAFKLGNIITMEPGIYLPGKYGVRIEDMIFLAPAGKRNLTMFPKELTIL